MASCTIFDQPIESQSRLSLTECSMYYDTVLAAHKIPPLAFSHIKDRHIVIIE